MNSITIITIIVVAFLTAVIFGLTWLAYRSTLKAYKMEIDQGKHDAEIQKEYQLKNKKSKLGLVGVIGSYLALSVLLGLFVTGVIYKARGENFSINNETALVIKSGSMSEFFDDELAEEYNHDTHLQFDVGDICIFETDFDLIPGEVYGYKRKNVIITHRLVKILDSGLCEFRGDANYISDGMLVQKEDIIYHYLGKKISGIGSFILYAQSYFGIWSLVGEIGVAIGSEIVYSKIEKINKDRNKLIRSKEDEEQISTLSD